MNPVKTGSDHCLVETAYISYVNNLSWKVKTILKDCCVLIPASNQVPHSCLQWLPAQKVAQLMEGPTLHKIEAQRETYHKKRSRLK